MTDVRRADRAPVIPDGSDRPRRLAVRVAIFAISVGLLALGAPATFDVPAVLALALVAAALDLRTVIALRNLVLAYAIGLFLVGGQLFYPEGPSLSTDLLLYLVAFLVAYTVYVVVRAPRVEAQRLAPRIDLSGPMTGRLESLLWLLLILQAVRLVLLILPYGPIAFYRGQELADRIATYRDTGSSGLASVTLILMTAVIIGVVVVYADHCLQAGVRIRYRLLMLVVLVPPVLALERAPLVYGVVMLAVLAVCDRRARGVATGAPANLVRQAVAAVLVLLAVAGLAAAIGQFRAERINDGRASGAQFDTWEVVLRSEFSPLIFYGDTRANIDQLGGYKYGEPLVGSLVTRLIPRSLWPDKPVTSTEVYMRVFLPDELAQGNSLAPSIFGVAYLNFGIVGTMIVLALLGWLCAVADRGFLPGRTARVPLLLIVATWLYSLLRDETSTALMTLLVSFFVYWAVASWMSRIAARSSPRPV